MDTSLRRRFRVTTTECWMPSCSEKICIGARPTAKFIAMKIAIQGELGSFSHEAAERMVRGARLVPGARSSEVFDRLEKGSVSGAVIPIENTLAGSIAEHYDLLLARNVHIEREFRLRIVHNLIAMPGAK